MSNKFQQKNYTLYYIDIAGINYIFTAKLLHHLPFDVILIIDLIHSTILFRIYFFSLTQYLHSSKL